MKARELLSASHARILHTWTTQTIEQNASRASNVGLPRLLLWNAGLTGTENVDVSLENITIGITSFAWTVQNVLWGRGWCRHVRKQRTLNVSAVPRVHSLIKKVSSYHVQSVLNASQPG